jgi:hypothetical protein
MCSNLSLFSVPSYSLVCVIIYQISAVGVPTGYLTYVLLVGGREGGGEVHAGAVGLCGGASGSGWVGTLSSVLGGTAP